MSLVCSSFGFGDMAAFMKNGKMERLDGKHCTFALGIAGSGRSQEWMAKNVRNSKRGTWQKIGRNKRLSVPSTKWLSLTHERFPHHTRPTFTRSTLLRGLAPHTARNKRSAVTCNFLPAIFALFGEISPGS